MVSGEASGFIGFLGAGLIGAALAEAAAKRGERVVVYNRTIEKARALEAFGARAVESPAEAVNGAARVHVVLTDDEAVDAVLAACGDAIVGPVLVDHSTTSPARTAARAQRLEARGAQYLHAPVFMSPQMCRESKGVMLCAGPREVFEKVERALARMTAVLEHVGERRDLAAAYKLFGNAMILAITAGLADMFTMARELGVDPVAAHALFHKFSPAGVIAYRGLAMANGDYRASFELATARKDARLMMESAGKRSLTVLPAIAARMEVLMARGHAADDLGVLSVDAVPSRNAQAKSDKAGTR